MEQLNNIETPSVILDYNILKTNIKLIQKIATNHYVHLRPHVKTHKCFEIAKLQLESGAVGLTCAKPSEAIYFIESGLSIHSITIAYPIIEVMKINNLIQSQQAHGNKTSLRFIVDSEYGADIMAKYFSDLTYTHYRAAQKHNIVISLFIKLDVGLGRVGLSPKDPQFLSLAKKIHENPHLQFLGLLSHAGHAYGKANKEQIAAVAKDEQQTMMDTKNMLESEGIQVKEISVGSTPTVLASESYEGITEIRPGNYVFMDRTPLSKGLVSYDRISLFIYVTVISMNELYIIIDGGSKVFSSDCAPHSAGGMEGYGEAFLIKDFENKTNKMALVKLSEEHGWIKREPHIPVQIGEKMIVVPNHSCPVANLTDHYVVINKEENPIVWKVDARGAVK